MRIFMIMLAVGGAGSVYILNAQFTQDIAHGKAYVNGPLRKLLLREPHFTGHVAHGSHDGGFAVYQCAVEIKNNEFIVHRSPQ